MGDLSLETGEHIVRVVFECCGHEKKRVWGFVTKCGDAHAVYYALLNITESRPRIGLISIGPWWEVAQASERSWCHIDVRTEPDKFQLVIKDPEESNFYPWEKGGRPLTPEQAAAKEMTAEIQTVANFVVQTDPAISSYLDGTELNTVGREPRDADGPQHNC